MRSEQRSEEKSGTTVQGGVPGVQANMGKAPTANSGNQNTGAKSDETMNYEISRSTARTIEPVGTLAKVSVAIMVDGKYDSAVKGSSTKLKYIPRSPEELQKIESLVKSAVGFNAERGDQLTVANISFQETNQDSAVTSDGWWNAPIFMALLKNGLIGLGFIALLLFVLRPLLAILKEGRAKKQESFVPVEETVDQLAEMQRAQLAMNTNNQRALAEQVINDPYQAAQILQNWLRQKNE